MEASTVEYMLHLRQNASLLRKEAREWGFTEREINQCIEEALRDSDNLHELANSPKNLMRTCWHYFRVTVKVMLLTVAVVTALLLGLTILTTYHEPSEEFVSNVLQPYGYQIFRTLRLVTLPVHKMFNVTHYYDSECIIENPFYVEEFNINCNICASYKNVKVVNASGFSDIKFRAFANTMKPVQIKGTLTRHVTYRDLRGMYLQYEDLLSNSPYQLHSSDRNMQRLDDVFSTDQESYINSSDGLHLDWESHTVSFSVALRTLFARPSYIPQKNEVSIDKHLIIDGPQTSTYQLPRLINTVNIYSQAGSPRRLLLRPRGPCKGSCHSLLALMDPGDALMYHYDLWEAFAITNGDHISIGYLVSTNL